LDTKNKSRIEESPEVEDDREKNEGIQEEETREETTIG
jgi:hypothetical protein